MNHMSVTVLLATLAVGIGIGELMMVCSDHAVRQWGRALKIASPVAAGSWVVVYALFNLDTDTVILSWDKILVGFGGLALATAGLRGAEKAGMLKATE